MGNAAARASAQAFTATSLANIPEHNKAAVLAQYGSTGQMAILTTKKIGIAYPRR